MGNTLNPVAKKQIVWLDVVRLLAMFMVVCCHSTDPFNFYPGEPPANISEIKCLRICSSSVCSAFCNDYGSFAVAGQR